jgi:O-succinylbenzoic acid--CoA ligase
MGGGVRTHVEMSAVHSVVYTSGTTGAPKGATLTYGNHLWSAFGSVLNLGLYAEDRWLACLPLFHVGGLAILLRSVIYGTTAIVHEGFDASRVNAAIDRDGVTIISVVANMLQRMLDERGDTPYPPSLRCVLLGGGPAPEALLRRCEALRIPVVQTYGLTETASQVATLSPEDALRKLGSAGKPLFGTEVRILDESGVERPAGGEGEIVVRGPTVTLGYLNHPEATASAIREGWLHTGDIGYLDADGFLYVLDRRDDLIVSGGENIYPAEVEAALLAHPAVADAGVTGEPDERWGLKPVAFVVLGEGAATAEELISHCRARLAAYKMPARIEFRDGLPRNAAGKLMRSQLRVAQG